VELFKITCVTCNAKLSVRNREIIGQIVACPRCDSMVQVEVPAAAIGAVAAADLSPEPVKNVSPQPAPPNDFADAAVEPEQLPVGEVSIQTAASVAKYRLLTWGLATIVVGAAIGGAILLLRGDSEAGNVDTTEIASQSESDPVDSLAEIAEKQPQESIEPVKPSNPIEPTSKAVEEKVEEPIETVVADEPIVPVESQPEIPTETEDAKTQADAEPRIANRFDALDLDPDTLDLATLKSAEGKPVVEEPVAVAPHTEAPVKETQPVHTTTFPVVRRDPEQERDPTRPPADELLEQRFPALTVKAMPLSDLLNLISQLGGVPISVAPQQLQMAGITSRQSVSLDLKDFSLAEALRKTLEPLHLEVTTVGPQAVIVRKDAAKIRTIEYPLDDLLDSATSREDVVGWVEQLVVPTAQPPLGKNILLKTSKHTMSLEQPQHFQYQVLIFLERLRLARGIQPRSRFPVKRLAGTAANVALAERIQAPTTFTFSHYTSASEIVRYWQQELGVPILVDWPALAKLGLWPNSRIACAVENKPWSAAFDQVLEPLGLGWRAVVGGTIEITSAEKVQAELQLELYQLSQKLGDQTDQVLDELRSIADNGGNENQPSAIAYDSSGKVLIVLQPAAAQRLVYQWLVDEELTTSD